MKIKLRVHEKSGMTYFPDELRNAGFKGDLDGYANAITLTVASSKASLDDIEKSLLIVLDDIRFRKGLERRKKIASRKSPTVETVSP